jgi:O-antigen ligase
VTGFAALSIAGIAVAAVAYGIPITAVFAAAGTVIVGEFLALRLRSSAFGIDLPLLRYLAALVVALALAIITFNGWRLNEHVAYSDLLLVAAGVLAVSSLGIEGMHPLPSFGWLLFSAALILITSAFSLGISADPGNAIASALEFCLTLLGVPVIISLVADSRSRLMCLTVLWAISAGVNGGVAVLDASHVTSIGPHLIGFVFDGRVTSLTLHPNYLGIACAMVLPICLSRLSMSSRPLYRVGWLTLLCLAALGILVSGSRAATIAGGVGLVLVLILQGRRARLVKIMSAGAIALAVVGLFATSGDSPLLVSLQRIGGGQSATASDVGRFQAFGDAVSSFESSPLTGHGFDLLRGAHDIYLQFLQAGGLLAFLGFTLFVIGSIRIGVRLSRSPQLTTEMRAVAASLVASLAVWLTAGLTQNYVYERVLYVPVGLLLGLALVERRTAARQSDAHAGLIPLPGRDGQTVSYPEIAE